LKKLTMNEQIFLIAIWHLGDEAYGLKIREKVMELTGSEVLFGTIYNTLNYLVKKDYVEARKGDPEQEKQDSKRVYYQITDAGFKALQKARKLQKTLWQGIPDFVSETAKK